MGVTDFAQTRMGRLGYRRFESGCSRRITASASRLPLRKGLFCRSLPFTPAATPGSVMGAGVSEGGCGKLSPAIPGEYSGGDGGVNVRLGKE